MEQILLVYGFPKETANGYTNFFDIVIGVVQRDKLAPYLFIISTYTSIEFMKENGVTLKKARIHDECRLCR